MRGITIEQSVPMQLAKRNPTPNTSSARRHGVCQVTPLNATATATAAAAFNAVMRSQYRAWPVTGSIARSLFVATDAARPRRLRDRAGGEPLAHLRRLARARRLGDQPVEVAARLLVLSEAMVALGQAEEQLAFGMIAEPVEVRHLDREHALVVRDGALEERAR